MIDFDAKRVKGYILKDIGKEQSKDTGMAMVLICLLVAFFGEVQGLIKIAIPLLLINMIYPNVYRPVAKLWLRFSTVLANVMSKVLLTVIYIALVTPVGMIRQTMAADPLQLKKWKKDDSSVFRICNRTIQSQDLEPPY